MPKKKFRLMTAAEGDDRTESSLYDYFHLTTLRPRRAKILELITALWGCPYLGLTRLCLVRAY
jgi:hypothetical protein